MMTQTIRADELTEGDIIKHFTGDTWLVISEPEYTCSGITFDVLWLDVDSQGQHPECLLRSQLAI